MFYISSDNKIMMYTYADHYEIINDTGYLPLCCHANVILMSDRKLYRVNYGMQAGNKLLLLHMISGDYYTFSDSDDFSRNFAKINSEPYEIGVTTLTKMPIADIKSHNIITTLLFPSSSVFARYYYVDVNNRLMVYEKSNKSLTVLDSNVDLIFLYGRQNGNHIVYKKNATIIYSACYITTLANTYVIDYSGSEIVKSSGEYVLDSDNVLYKFVFVDKKYYIKKILSGVTDFNYCMFKLLILNSEHQICTTNCHNYGAVRSINGGCFEKKMCNVKSANKLCRP